MRRESLFSQPREKTNRLVSNSPKNGQNFWTGPVYVANHHHHYHRTITTITIIIIIIVITIIITIITITITITITICELRDLLSPSPSPSLRGQIHPINIFTIIIFKTQNKKISSEIIKTTKIMISISVMVGG